MTNAQALAKLIENAPELAGEVMPEGYGTRSGYVVEYGVAYDEKNEPYPAERDVDRFSLPTLFYQAVAGKLAEWLCDRDGSVRRCDDLVDGCRYCVSMGQRHGYMMLYGPTYFAALVEAAIAVHNAA